MQWRKEPNNFRYSKLCSRLTDKQTRVYFLMKDVAGAQSSVEREGYLERSEGVPYSIKELSILIGESEQDVDDTIRICKDAGEIENNGGCIQFLNWIEVDKKKVKRHPSSAEKEYFDRANQERLNRLYPDGVSEAVNNKVLELINDGKLRPTEEAEDEDGI